MEEKEEEEKQKVMDKFISLVFTSLLAWCARSLYKNMSKTTLYFTNVPNYY